MNLTICSGSTAYLTQIKTVIGHVKRNLFTLLVRIFGTLTDLYDQ